MNFILRNNALSYMLWDKYLTEGLLLKLNFKVKMNELITECPPGYTGPDCFYTCIYPYYGEDCFMRCDCSPEMCDFVSGCKLTTTTGQYSQKSF